MALNLKGFNVGGLRLPLTEMQKENAKKLKEKMEKIEII